MNYLVLVSHGEFAYGLKSALSMLAGEKEEVIACGLKDGKTADEFAKQFEETIAPITADDKILLLADIIGGSPLTTASNVLAQKGYLANTTMIGGMNLPLALTAVLMKDSLEGETLVSTILSEGTGAMKQFVVETNTDEDDDI